jgi:protein TonB
MPEFAKIQITPPKIPVATRVQMPDPSIEAQPDLKMANSNMPNLGDPKSPLVGDSMGSGSGTGIGSGSGSGFGPGSGGNAGGGIMHVGGGVSAPVPIFEVTPEFSEEARKAKFQGVVMVSLVVDAKGLPESVRVTRGVGMGLDEKAVAAVKQYRFKPAMMGGKPVAVEVNVEVNFQIF